MWCLTCALYTFTQLLLSLNWTEEQYLFLHKLKIFFAVWAAPFWFYTSYEILIPKSKKIIPFISLFFAIGITLCIPFDIFTSMPVKTIEIDSLISIFIYHTGKTNFVYSIWSIEFVICILISIIQFSRLESSYKRNLFILLLILSILSALNDFAVSHSLIYNILVFEINFFFLLLAVFVDFLNDERKTNNAVSELSKNLQKEKDEVTELSKELKKEKDQAIHRLHIMEIYTRRSLVEAIERGDDPTKFVSKNVQITTLFSDIRDFTGISEGKEPIEVVNLLNSYFEQMNKVIIKYGGEIDKLMGDCIMALFHNPDDSLKAAIEMRKELTEFNIGVNNCSPIQNGIGLNYGEVIIGNIGSESKMDYTVVGDIVNTASRLEALTKYYKVHLIISEEMKKQLEGSYHIRFFDEVPVKGKSNQMKIYEVFDFEPPEVIAMKERNVKPLAEAFAYYQRGEFDKAIEIYESVVAIQELPLQDPVLPFFISRCRKLQEQKQAGLLKQWNGVFEFMDK